MDPIVQKIMDNYSSLAKKYQGGEKAMKMHEYYLKCLNKLKDKKRDDLVVKLRHELRNKLDYAKRKSHEADQRAKSYLRGPAQLNHQADNSVKRSTGDSPPDIRTTRKLPFRKDAN